MRKISFLGPEGTYSAFALNKYDSEASRVPCRTFSEALGLLESGKVTDSIVPIENSLHGSIVEVLDFLIETPSVKIKNELLIKIDNCLLSKSKMELSEIEVLFSHPQPLGQCKDYINQNLSHARLVASLSTMSAIEDLENSGLKGAVIGPKWAAEQNKLNILEEKIDGDLNNITRFVILSKKDSIESTGNKKISIVFSFDKDSPGSLFEVLRPFAIRKINLTKIESRPTRKQLGRYYFFIDIEGNLSNPEMKKVLDEILNYTSELKILGSYPKVNYDF
ncbi:MAG: prephenate dehydratase [Chloroflexi bacterium]|nr:prephenate dehydratase [Chloroflexota bacterium]|tara:strand:- start:42 stop:875 length:834 start_codon:yes stop_codon:yes gene_type:complete